MNNDYGKDLKLDNTGVSSEFTNSQDQASKMLVLPDTRHFSPNTSTEIPLSLNGQYSIELHIEELVLHGFSLIDRYRISEAIEQELTRLFTEQGVPASLIQYNEVASLNVGDFRVAENSKAAAIGVQIAQAMYGGLVR
ncbi:MAG: hypothetical protein AB1489_16270 [Acidobacteriota bacterium]